MYNHEQGGHLCVIFSEKGVGEYVSVVTELVNYGTRSTLCSDMQLHIDTLTHVKGQNLKNVIFKGPFQCQIELLIRAVPF